jgi:hypothetical protein
MKLTSILATLPIFALAVLASPTAPVVRALLGHDTPNPVLEHSKLTDPKRGEARMQQPDQFLLLQRLCRSLPRRKCSRWNLYHWELQRLSMQQVRWQHRTVQQE